MGTAREDPSPPPTVHPHVVAVPTRTHGLAAFSGRGLFAEQYSAYFGVAVELGPLQRGLSVVVFERVVRTFICCESNDQRWFTCLQVEFTNNAVFTDGIPGIEQAIPTYHVPGM